MSGARAPLRVAIGGLGAIGFAVAKRLDEGIEGLELVAVSAGNLDRAGERIAGFGKSVPAVPLEMLGGIADVIVECAPSSVFDRVANAAIDAGRIFMPLSGGAMLSRMHLVDRARETGARIIVPTGALVGFDAVRAAAEGEILSVTMETRKPPAGLAGAPYLVENGISVEGLNEPKLVFSGSARDGAKGFPANVNVAAALSLAGIGPDKTRLDIWADPTVTRNTHKIVVDADSTRFTMLIEGIPSVENPRTGKLTPLSVIACLKGLVQPLKIGS